jgi:hypothetical protein
MGSVIGILIDKSRDNLPEDFSGRITQMGEAAAREPRLEAPRTGQATRSENVSWISQSKLAGTLPSGSAYSRRK